MIGAAAKLGVLIAAMWQAIPSEDRSDSRLDTACGVVLAELADAARIVQFGQCWTSESGGRGLVYIVAEDPQYCEHKRWPERYRLRLYCTDDPAKPTVVYERWEDLGFVTGMCDIFGRLITFWNGGGPGSRVVIFSITRNAVDEVLDEYCQAWELVDVNGDFIQDLVLMRGEMPTSDGGTVEGSALICVWDKDLGKFKSVSRGKWTDRFDVEAE